MKRICVFSLTILFFLCFFGCGFSPLGDDGSEVSGKGIHSVSGFTEVAEGKVRNAFPSYDDSKLFYHFYAKKSSGEAAAAESTGAKNSFSFLSCLSCKFALDLKRHGYEKGDTFYALLVFIGE